MQIKRGAAWECSFPFLSFPGINAAKLNDRSRENAENFLSSLLQGLSLARFLRPAAVVDRSRGLLAITLVPTRHLNAMRSAVNATNELWRKIASIDRQIFPTVSNFDPPYLRRCGMFRNSAN